MERKVLQVGKPRATVSFFPAQAQIFIDIFPAF
jgi:hypothetical protein